jgi:general bacterial porin, GBP family
MKKTWVALAVAGAFAAGAAQAQSSVTLYGIADVNVQMRDPASGKSTVGVNSGHQSGSRWGLRGSEDLGGGLKGIFTLEGGYDVDRGMLGQGNRLFGRQAFVGLQGGFGTVALGRLSALSSGTGSLDMFGFVDPFLTGFGGLNLVFSSANALRVDNAIAWQSPRWGGFQFGASHSFNANGAETPDRDTNTHVTGFAAGFGGGPFRAAVTYDIINNPSGASDQKHLQIGGTFDLAMVKLHAGYAKEDNIFVFNSVGITNGSDADAWMVGATLKLGAGSLMASFNNYDNDAVAGVERDLRRYGIAYSHPLSRRTNLYASVAENDGRKSLKNSAFDYRQYTVGVRHLF